MRSGFAALALLAMSCGAAAEVASEQPETPRATPGVDTVWQRGRATYYADSLAGRPTASGEPYDPTAMTAAHRTLPFGTVIRVERSDGRSVEVRVNDRGPFGRSQNVVDLSRAAAERLGMLRQGVVDVAIRIVAVPIRW